MASFAPPPLLQRRSESLAAGLARRDRAIASPLADALFFWGAPLLAFALMLALGEAATRMAPAAGDALTRATLAAVSIVTYAHLIAVAPRAYLNREVFARHRTRLTVVPVLLVAAMLLSPAALVAGFVLAVFWDVHHSAMQTFGLGRIYDMKAGNDPQALRRVDLWLNSALYIGPIAAGASMIVHLRSLDEFSRVGLAAVTTVPAWASAEAPVIRSIAILAWLGVVGGAMLAYARAARGGYRLSPHKQALLLATASVSILAWGLAPPLLAFMTINLFHAVQYFALVWLKEGGRMRAAAPRLGRLALPGFVLACLAFGTLYWIVHERGTAAAGAWLAPFVACSLLHFWYDAFVWSVRKKLV